LKLIKEFTNIDTKHIAGIEFIMDETEQIFTYDVNTNTNYNPDAEALVEVSGMREIAKHLGKELDKLKLENK